MVRKTEPKSTVFSQKLNRNRPTSRWAKPLQHKILVHSVTSISGSIFSTLYFPLPWDRHLRVHQVNISPDCTLPCNAWLTSISVLIRNPVFCSSPVLLFWSLPCIAHDQHNGHPFFIVASNTFCPAVFLAASASASCQVTFSILLVIKSWKNWNPGLSSVFKIIELIQALSEEEFQFLFSVLIFQFKD